MERVSPITRKAIEHIKNQKEYADKLNNLKERIDDYFSSDIQKGLPLNDDDIKMIQKALEFQKISTGKEIERQERAIKCGSESGDLRSHGEKEILQGCVRLLCEAGEHFREYLEYIGVEPDKEVPLSIPIQYGHIVKHLFLWNTYHSGGTSTRAKCRELGVEFDDEVEIIENEDDDQ